MSRINSVYLQLLNNTSKIIQYRWQRDHFARRNNSERSSCHDDIWSRINTSSVIRQKGESQNGFFEKTKHAKFSEKTSISYPLIRTRTYAYQGVRNCSFTEHFANVLNEYSQSNNWIEYSCWLNLVEGIIFWD